MEKISSPIATFDFKFAKFWIWFITVCGVISIISTDFYLPFLLGITTLLISGSLLFYHTVWCVVDEVEDCGTYLVFKKGEDVQKVFLSEITKIDHPYSNFKGLIRVHVNDKGAIGRRLTFRSISSAASRFSETKTFKNLLGRIDSKSIS